MENEEEKTLFEILDEFKDKEEENNNTQIINHEDIKKVEKDEKDIVELNSFHIESNKNNNKHNFSLSFAEFITKLETTENKCFNKIIYLFLDSVINLLNIIIKEEYKSKKKLILPNIRLILKKISLNQIKLKKILDLIIINKKENIDIIFHTLKIERKKGKTIFENLINLSFKELYDYFINNCTIIIIGRYIYNLNGVFKTLIDVIKDNKEFEEELYQFLFLEKMEIDTISLENYSINNEIINIME